MPSFTERQFERAAEREFVADVEGGAAALCQEITRVLDRTVARFTAGVVDAVCPCPRTRETYGAHPPLESGLQRVVDGIAPRHHARRITQVRVGTARDHSTGARD